MLSRFDTEELEEAIEASYSHDTVRTKEAFPTELCHFPDFSTRDIHRNYVDCCRWFGDFILSKSCENKIVCWKPGSLDRETEVVDRLSENKSVVIHQLDLRDCDIWFMRFSLDPSSRLLALGNQAGRIWVWDLETEEPRQIRGVQLDSSEHAWPAVHVARDAQRVHHAVARVALPHQRGDGVLARRRPAHTWAHDEK